MSLRAGLALGCQPAGGGCGERIMPGVLRVKQKPVG